MFWLFKNVKNFNSWVPQKLRNFILLDGQSIARHPVVVVNDVVVVVIVVAVHKGLLGVDKGLSDTH